MQVLQNDRVVLALTPRSLATDATLTSSNIDTIGFDTAAVEIIINGSASTASRPTQLRLQHADVTDSTSFVNITGYTANTSSAGYPANAGNTSATQVFARMTVDLRDKRRYLRVLVDGGGSGGTTAFASVVCHLGRAQLSPTGTNVGALFVQNPF
jgi:hypothetical protein